MKQSSIDKVAERVKRHSNETSESAHRRIADVQRQVEARERDDKKTPSVDRSTPAKRRIEVTTTIRHDK